jgi:photosystem II stability/assembly factor-like uncharacterized protein
MLSRSSLAAAGLTAALLPAVFFPAAALASRSGRAPSAPSAAHAQAVQSVQQAWTIGASTAWAWTVDESGAAGTPQGLELTTNGGKTWTRVTPPGLGSQGGDHYITGLYALNASHAWVTYGGLGNGAAQTIASTSDGGRRWTAVGHEPLSHVSYSTYDYDCALDFVTASIGWCETTPAFVGSEGVFIYRTTNGGRTWQLVSVTPGPPPDPKGSLPWEFDKDTQFVTPTVGWTVFTAAGSVTAPLYESVNGGTTWVKRSVAKAPGSFDGGSGFTGQPVIAGKAGAVGYTIGGLPLKSIVYVTTDGGLAWHPVTPPGKSAGWLVDVINPDTWRLVDGNHILATNNAGHTWRTITSNVSFSLYYSYDDPTAPVVHFATASTGWIALNGLWRTTNGGSTWHKLAVPGT